MLKKKPRRGSSDDAEDGAKNWDGGAEGSVEVLFSSDVVVVGFSLVDTFDFALSVEIKEVKTEVEGVNEVDVDGVVKLSSPAKILLVGTSIVDTLDTVFSLELEAVVDEAENASNFDEVAVELMKVFSSLETVVLVDGASLVDTPGPVDTLDTEALVNEEDDDPENVDDGAVELVNIDSSSEVVVLVVENWLLDRLELADALETDTVTLVVETSFVNSPELEDPPEDCVDKGKDAEGVDDIAVVLLN